jgi:hypothetical protein
MLKRVLTSAAIVCVSVLSLSGCGSSSPTTPSPYTQSVGGTVSAFGTTRHSLTIPQSGNMSLTLTWGDSSIDLDLYLTAASCQQLYPMNQCNIILASNSAQGAVRENVSRSVSSGETYSIFVDNLNLSKSTSYTLDIRIQ